MICTVGVPGGFQIKRRVTTGDQEDKIVEAYEGYRRESLTAIGRALLLGICDRTFRRYMNRYDKDGIKGLLDKRLVQVSQRRAPVDEIMRMVKPVPQPSHGLKAACKKLD